MAGDFVAAPAGAARFAMEGAVLFPAAAVLAVGVLSSLLGVGGGVLLVPVLPGRQRRARAGA